MKFVATTKRTRNTDEVSGHHFFASSLGRWKVGYDLETLIKTMKRDGMPFNVYMVPGPVDTPYEIEWFAPQVEGVVWLTFYGKA